MRAPGGRWVALVLVGVTMAACTAAPAPPPLPALDAAAHRAEVETWQEWRHNELVKPDGWLSLSGLYWLLPGTYRLGSAPANELVYDRAGVPPILGTLQVTPSRVEFEAAPEVGVELAANELPLVAPVVFDADVEGGSTVMTWGDLQWFVIQREDHLALRLKDGASPLVMSFSGVEYFDPTAEWRLDARFEPHEPPQTITIPNVFGTLGEEESPGAVVFEIDGETYRLDMWRDSDDPENYFTAFGDQTNAQSTYGAGRFLWVNAPDEWGRTVVDFNRAYNPPCAFSPFATCPLPPVQNRLPLVIEAGERAFSQKVALPAGPPGSEPPE